MALFSGSVYSHALTMSTGLTVSVPSGLDEEMPVLYLLHGLSNNHQSWVSRSNVDRYAEQAGLAVVMPEVQRSFYLDMRYGLPYFRYLTEELPRLCRRMFRFSARREDNFVAGLSMGGYGAVKAALSCPGQYLAGASFSGAVDVRDRLNGGSVMTPEEVFAVGGGELAPGDDLFSLAERAAADGGAPFLYITCGRSDFLYEDNQRFCRHLESLSLPFAFEEWPGAHEWDFWDESVKRAISRFMAMREQEKSRG